MSQIDTLLEAGFTGEEVTAWAGEQRTTLTAAGFSEAEIDKHLGVRVVDVAGANRNLAASVQAKTSKPAGALRQMAQTVKDVSTVYAPIEAAMNLVTGVVGGFPAYLGGGVGTLLLRGIGVSDADPKEVATRIAEAMTYQPRTEAGQRLSGTVNLPLHALVEMSEKAGKAVADKTGSPTAAALTEATLQMLPAPFLGALGKTMRGKTPNQADFRAAAQSMDVNGKLDPKATTELGQKVQKAYEATGIDPETLVDAARTDPAVMADIASTNRNAPKAFEPPAGEPPKPPGEPPKPPTPPEPPTPGTPEAAQAAVLERISVGESTTKTRTLDELYTAAKDDLYPIAKIEKALNDGVSLDTAESPYKLARLSRGAAGKATQFLDYGTFDFKTYENTGPGLKQILEPVKNDLDGFRAYAVSRRALELEGRGIETGVPSAEANTVVNAGKGKYGEAFDQLQQYQTSLVTYLKDAGIIKPETYSAMLEANKDYVPFFRLMDGSGGTGIGAGLRVRNPIKSIKGSERVILDPLESIIKNTYVYTSLAERNAVGKAFGDLVFKENTAQPIRGYHGTQAEIARVTDLSKSADFGPHFSVERGTAEVFAKDQGRAGKVLEGDLHFTNVLDMPDLAGWHPLKVAEWLDNNGYTKHKGDGRNLGELGTKALTATEDAMRQGAKAGSDEATAPAIKVVKDWLLSKGYDAIRYENTFEGKPADSFIALDMAKVSEVGAKSAEVRTLAADLGVEQVKAGNKPVEVSAKEMQKFMDEHGIEGDAEAFTIFRPNALRPEPNHIRYFEDGQPITLKVPDALAEAFNAADQQTAGMLLKVLAFPAKTLRAGSVLAPDFMGRNVIRDQLTAFSFSKNGYIPVWDMVSGFMSIAKKDGVFQDWLKSGGANSTMISMDRQYLQQHIFELDKQTGLLSRGWNVVKSPIEILRITSELAENATRVGEFKRAMGGQESGKAAIQDAGFESREVTLDFQRIGAKTRALNMVSAFFNAAVEGQDRTIRAFKDQPLGTAAKVAAGITVPSMLLWYANHDDPRWKEIPSWQRDLFWIVMTDDHIYRIPKPFELGVIFGSLPERMLDKFAADNPDAMKGFGSTLAQAFGVNVMPTGAVPILEQLTKHSFFTGNPLIPARMEGILPEYQYHEYTSELTKAVGSLIGSFPGLHDKSIASPVVIDNYISGWTGALGRYTTALLDKAGREAGLLPEPDQPTATLADIPVVKAFVVRYPAATAQSIQDFYSAYGENKKVYTTFQYLVKNGDPDAAIKEAQLDPGAFARMDGIAETLATLNANIRTVYRLPKETIGPDEKRQLIDAMYGQMIELARSGKESMAEVDKVLKQK